ncbi:hypothetical protein Tco_0465605 [Tanacetum coccineum]
MLVQPTQDEGATSERLSEAQPTPSPEPTSEAPNESLPDSSSAQSSEVPFEQQPDLSPSPSPRPSPNPSPTPNIPDSIPEHTGENLGDHSFNDTSLSGNEDAMTLQNVYDLCISLCKQVSDQAKEIELLKAKIKRLKKKATPVINHFKAYQKRISKEQRQQRKRSSKKKRVQKESYDEQMDKVLKIKVMLLKRIFEGTKEQGEGLKEKVENETIATLLIIIVKAKTASKEKEKGIELKDVEDAERPRPTSKRSTLTLKPLPKIDPKDKGKKKIEEEDESESEDDDIPQAVKKFKQLENDERPKDERLIKKMNEKRGGLSKSEVIKEDTKEEVKDEDKDEESTRKRKLGTRKKSEVKKQRRYINTLQG